MFNRWVVIYVAALIWGGAYLTIAVLSQAPLSLSAAVWAALLAGFSVGGFAGLALLAAWYTVRDL